MCVKIIINGVLGRMGREIADLAISDNEITICGCLEREGHPAEGNDIGDYTGAGKTGIPVSTSFKEMPLDNAVIIDFSTPESIRAVLKEISGKDTRLVIGTTGLTDEDVSEIKNTALRNAVLLSPNMSLGVNFLFYLTRIASEKLSEDFDIEIIETHHRYKKDSPSGTAKKLGEIICETVADCSDDSIIYGRDNNSGQRKKNQVGIHSVRGGDITGDHTVLFAGHGERLELKHTAHSRKTFAKGAIKAAKWLNLQEPGLYSMRDVLGF